MNRFLKIFIIIVVVAIFAATFIFLYRNSMKKDDRYELVEPRAGIDISRSTILTGKIEPRDLIDIKPQISGIISEVLVTPGDMVAEGEIIARIKVIPEASQLSSAQNRVEQARIQLEDARVKSEREDLLYSKKLVSKEECENATVALRKAELELNAAIDAYNIVREGISATNATESNTNVRATITGQVLDVPVKVGSSVIQANTFNDGTTVATIADMNDMIFIGKVDETDIGSLSTGIPVEITVGALPDRRLSAVIEYIAPRATSENGANSFEIKAALTSDSISGLRSGYSANASFAINSARGVMAVPESVVEFKGDSSFVYIATDTVGKQSFRRTAITTGVSDGVNIEVRSGLDLSDRLRGKKINE